MGQKKKAREVFEDIYKNKDNSNYKEESLYEIIVYSLNNNDLDKANELIKDFNRKFGR